MPRKTHGHRRGADGKKSPTFMSWEGMKQRCSNPKHIKYHDYGGRGISFNPRWRDFSNFLADMGVRPEGTTLNRLRGGENYSKENCEWANSSTQNKNRRPWPQQKSKLTGRFIGSKKTSEASEIGSDDQLNGNEKGGTDFEF